MIGIVLFIFIDFSYQFEVPEPTRRVTPLPKPSATPLDGTNNYIDKIFSNDELQNQIIVSDNNNKQISGCTFTDLNNKNSYVINIQKDAMIFNNIFQNSNYPTDTAGFATVTSAFGQITISRCKFVKYAAPDSDSVDGIILTVDVDNPGKIIFEYCEFIDCSNGKDKYLINYLKAGCNANFTECEFTFNDSNKRSKILNSKSPEIIFDRCQFTQSASTSINAQLDTGTTSIKFQFTNNIVKSIKGTFIDISYKKTALVFTHNTFHDVTTDGALFINIAHNENSLNLQYNSFSHFRSSGNSDFGGISTCFKRLSIMGTVSFTLIYDHCSFLDVYNMKTTSPNSNGGAINFGFIKDLAQDHVKLSNSIFKGNKASKHGGAVAIAVNNQINIKNCTFEENRADNQKVSGSSLLEEKADGRGGAIFICTKYQDKQVADSLIIEDCTFRKNTAFDGYGIYIDGEEMPTGTTSIKNNKFFDNYNGDQSSSSLGAAIACELLEIGAIQIESDNEFYTVENGSGSKLFYYVYHNGDKYPDPTQTPEQTPAETSTPTGPTTYIDKSFTQDDFKAVNAGSATATVKQVSGCTFSNINIATSDYMFGVNGAFSFFNNVFQNDDNTERSCPLKVFNLKSILNFVISRCKFTKIVSKANVNGNILYTTLPTGTGATATAFAAHITFEFCEFTDCSSSKDQTLVYLANAIDTASFTNCKFIFSDAVGEGCRVLDSNNPGVVFDGCQFTRTGPKTINIQSTKTTNPGEFKFTNNRAESLKGCLIDIADMNTKPVITGNTFHDVTLADGQFISINHGLDNVLIKDTTFSKFRTSGNSNFGGFATSLKYFKAAGTGGFKSAKFTLTFDFCTFSDIVNSKTESPKSNGGAVQFGFSSDLTPINVVFTNSTFRGNRANKHGGAVAIQIEGYVVFRDCIFEQNRADCQKLSESAKLLVSEEKDDGLGGAIFISTEFQDGMAIDYVTIEGCLFNMNVAHDGYAIYVEGDEDETIFTVRNNKFFNNYNGNSSGALDKGAVFASEVIKIKQNQIETDNEFANELAGKGSLKFHHVQHSGEQLPDPTPLPSPTIPSEPTVKELCSTDATGAKRCEIKNNPEVEDERNIVVKVSKTEFNYIQGEKGGAIHLENCGLEMKDSCKFIGCLSTAGPGGAIYIHNPTNVLNPVRIEGHYFEGNQAPLNGGAIYIYSSWTENIATITKCNFVSNSIQSSDASASGCAIYLKAMKGVVIKCKFTKNYPGASMRIDSDFTNDEVGSLVQLEAKKNVLTVSDCSFEIGKNSLSSIFFKGGRRGPSLDVKNCVFVGKLNKGAHHIDGELVEEKTPQMTLKSSKFSSGALGAVSKNLLVSVNASGQVFGYIERSESSLKMIAVVSLTSLVVIVAIIVCVIKKVRSTDQNNQKEDQIDQKMNI